MIKIFCDRCGNMIPAQEEVLINIAPGAESASGGAILCFDCKSKFDAFILNAEDVAATGKATIEVKPPK